MAKTVKIKKDSAKLEKAERYNPDPNTGLSQEQVEERIQDNLVNAKPPKRSKSFGKILFDNFFNFCNGITVSLVILLIAIGAIDYAISSFIIFISISIGILQEVRAKRTVEKLSLISESTCEVIRDGKSVVLSSRDIVLDDIYKIWSGAQVPVDSIILSGRVEVDESILTGESSHVTKGEGDTLLAASNIVSGEVILRADKVGKDCYIENIARIARRVSKPQSKIFYSLNKIIKGISIALVPLCALLFISSMIVTKKPFYDTVIDVASSALAMIPIGMFLITSTALAAGVIKLSKKNTLAKDLYSIEMLAMVDTLLLDKTGTITDGELEVVEEKILNENEYPVGDIMGALLRATGDKNSTAKGLRKKYGEFGETLQATAFVPFSSDRKYSGVEIGGVSYILGAPSFACGTSYEVSCYAEESACLCRRTLVLGRFNGPLTDFDNDKTIPIAVFALEDTLRADVKETIDWFYRNGVDIKIVSGDNPLTVSRIAAKSGIQNAENYLNCQNLSTNELCDKVMETVVFGRIMPEQKHDIVSYLQSQGRVVGMIGDGVNDVPALKEADCSISFASANEAARNISRIVLMDSNFKSLPKVVEEGRSVIGNMEKVSALYVMKNLFVMFFTLFYAIMGLVTKDTYYPFDTKRMLLIEFFVLGIPIFILALQPNKKRCDGNFLKNILKSAFPAGLSIIAGVGFILLLFAFKDMSYIGGVNEVRQYTASIAAIVLTLAGFSALFIVSLPFNRFRLIVIFTMLIVTVLGVWMDGSFFDGLFLNISYPLPRDIIYIVLGVIIATAVNIFGRRVAAKIADKIEALYLSRKKLPSMALTAGTLAEKSNH